MLYSIPSRRRATRLPAAPFFTLALCVLMATAAPAAFAESTPADATFNRAALTASSVVYVDADATGAGDGSSWTDAYTTLQDALAAAGANTEIWIADGVYYPDEGAGQSDNDPSSTFQLPDGVAVYGGFNGTETARESRAPGTNVVVLSGDLEQNDANVTGGVSSGVADLSGTQASSVVTVASAATVVLSGVTVTAGQVSSGVRAGIRNSGTLTLSDAIITVNSGGGGAGGGLSNDGTLTGTRLVISKNQAGVGGGLYALNSSQTSLTDVQFVDNLGHGGGLTTEGSGTLERVTFSGNSAPSSGTGGAWFNVGTFTASNSTFVGNTSTQFGGAIVQSGGALTLMNSTLSGNTAGNSGGGALATNSPATIVNSILWGNSATGGEQKIGLFGGTVTVNTAIIQGGCPSGVTCTGVLTSDPLLQTLADGGGFVPTMALGTGSPAIGAADNAQCPATDARGFNRDANCDLGAYEADAALPVELATFSATPDGTDLYLRWTTASETNNAGFEIEHQAPQQPTWTRLGFTAGHGTTLQAQAYQHRLTDWPAGRHRFRLKQIDYDGTFAYSGEIETVVELAEAYQLTAVYPNPLQDTAQLQVAVREAQPVTVAVYDLLGRRVQELHRGVLAAQTSARLVIDGAQLAAGAYVVRIRGESFSRTQRFVVVR